MKMIKKAKINKEFVTNSIRETQEFAQDFAKKLAGGDIVALYGNLGSGKTTFVQGLAKGLGIKSKIISPTFLIIRSYECKPLFYSSSEAAAKSISLRDSGQVLRQRAQDSRVARMTGSHVVRTITFYHIDLYRIETEKDAEGLGILDIFDDKNAIVVIEWAEKMQNLLPKKRIEIHFEYVGEEKRKITVLNKLT